jgi:hypothetical protein
MAFFLPWYIFLFIGAFDWGFYAHSLISVQAAARAAAIATSANATAAANQQLACDNALPELRIASNVPTTLTTCGSLPVIVTTQLKTGANSADGADASEVDVSYQTPALIPIPGILQGQITMRRVVQMRLRTGS